MKNNRAQFEVKKQALLSVLKDLNEPPKERLKSICVEVEAYAATLANKMPKPDVTQQIPPAPLTVTQAVVPKLDDATIATIIERSEALSRAFTNKLIQFINKPKMIQWGTQEEAFTLLIASAASLEEKLKQIDSVKNLNIVLLKVIIVNGNCLLR